MAKQIVREIDNSVPVLPSYSNFSVVVPGYVAAEKLSDPELWPAVADGNDIYEVNTITDFENYIGFVPGGKAEAVAPVLKVLRTETEEEETIDITVDSLSASDALKYYNNGVLYRQIAKDPQDPNYSKIGHLQDEGHTYEKVSDINDIKFVTRAGSDTAYTEDYDFCVIEANKEGQDARVREQIGNQIAYNLISLGYTVLYMNIATNRVISTDLATILADDKFWEPLKDKSMYQFRYITTGGYYGVAAMNAISKLANFVSSKKEEDVDRNTYGTLADTTCGRGDVIALCDVDESLVGTTYGMADTIRKTYNAIAGMSQAKKYSAIFAPRVIYDMTSTKDNWDGNETFPASFHYLACAAYTHSRFAEWYAVAGYNRGISDLTIKGVTLNFGDIAQNTLAPSTIIPLGNGVNVSKSINLIVTERNSGYYLWGNRTAEPITKTGLKWSHYLNVRQLCTTIKKQVIYLGKMYSFDPNSDVLWINFKSGIEPLLQKMESDQGIETHKITRSKNKIKGCVQAKIRIVPIEAAEDFDVSLFLEDSLENANYSVDESE